METKVISTHDGSIHFAIEFDPNYPTEYRILAECDSKEEAEKALTIR